MFLGIKHQPYSYPKQNIIRCQKVGFLFFVCELFIARLPLIRFFFQLTPLENPFLKNALHYCFWLKKRYHIDCGFKAKKKFLYSSSIFYIIFHGKWFIKRVGAYLDRCIIFVLHTICMRFFPLIWMWERLQIAFQWISPVSIWF